MTEHKNPHVSDLTQDRFSSDLNGKSVNAIDYLDQEGTFQDKRVKKHVVQDGLGKLTIICGGGSPFGNMSDSGSVSF